MTHRETSVTFSLQELLQLEEDRIAQEHRRKAEQIESDRQAQIALERAAMARKLELARQAEEQAERRRRRLAEEQASLEAIRVQSEVAARYQQESLQDARRRAHELEMGRLAMLDQRRVRRAMAAGAAAGLVFGLLLGAIPMGVAQSSHNRERQEWQSKIREAEEREANALRLAESRQCESDDPLDNRVDDGRANPSLPKPKARAVQPRQHQGKPTQPQQPTQPCIPGDPLCGNL